MNYSLLYLIYYGYFYQIFYIYQKYEKLDRKIIFHAIFWPPCYFNANYRPGKKIDRECTRRESSLFYNTNYKDISCSNTYTSLSRTGSRCTFDLKLRNNYK